MSDKGTGPTYKAEYRGHVVARSNRTIVVDGYRYFPAESVNTAFFRESATQSTCKWKGVATYKHLAFDDKILTDAAWYYPEPKAAAQEIQGYFAFWRGVLVGPA